MTNRIVLAEQNDTIDALVYRHFGYTSGGLVEQTVALNRGLAARGVVITQGTSVVLPAPLNTTHNTTKTVQLWD